MRYEIYAEPYTMKASAYTAPDGRVALQKPVQFEYVIQRADGSRVFRAQTLGYAETLLSRLLSGATAT